MTAREIKMLGNEVLRSVCEEVEDPTSADVRALVDDLRDTLNETYRRTGYGRGIAAPQIGVLQRVVYLSPRVLGEELVLVSPKIISRSDDMITVWDSCLCFLAIFMKVERHRTISVEYRDLQGTLHRLDAGPEHDLSELLQHEIDHLDGILCVDLVQRSSDIVSREVFEDRFRSETPYA